MTVDAQASFAATFTDELVRSGVEHVVICPGSRSAPMAVALIEDGRLRVHVVLDERSGGFLALGVGLATGKPAVVLTTSGTAAVELHPAIVEAHQAGVPLLALTADRPPELHHVGAPQTVEQSSLFGGALRASFDFGVPTEDARQSWRSLASRAVASTRGGAPGGPGPVHVNLPFREPLVGGVATVPSGRRGDHPWHRLDEKVVRPPAASVIAELSHGHSGILVAGGGCDPDGVHRLAAALGWPVLADPRSGARLPRPTTIASADSLLRVEGFAAVAPDLVVTVGDRPASRVVNDWLATIGSPHIVIDPERRWVDPHRQAALVSDCDLGLLADAVSASGGRADPGWLSRWRAADDAVQTAFDEVLARHLEVTEPGVARSLLSALPASASLFVSSSMPIRDLEWYGGARSGVRVFSNRGANGIDGVVSAGVGVATTATGPTFVLLGDLAFLHDVNGLLAARNTSNGVDLVLVVVDNDGGGIFSFLPHRQALAEPRFERLFGTPHGLNLRTVAAAYGVEAERVTAAADVVPAISRAAGAGGVRMVHVRTDRNANVAVHAELNAAAEAALNRLG